MATMSTSRMKLPEGAALVSVAAVTVTTTSFDAASSAIVVGSTVSETVTRCVTGAVGALVSVSRLERSSRKDTRTESASPTSPATGV